MKVNYKVVMTAIVGLTAIEIVALCNGINGTLMTICVAAIAGLAGWVIPVPKIKDDK